MINKVIKKKNTNLKDTFNLGDYVVYPAHGVGKFVDFEVHEIDGHKVELLVISFDKDKMVLRLPKNKTHEAGLRQICSEDDMRNAIESLKVKTRPKRAMWSRRAQEYETKINSGIPESIAEVLRELYKKNNESEQSYSERQIYQAALARLARELAAIESIAEEDAAQKIENLLKVA